MATSKSSKSNAYLFALNFVLVIAAYYQVKPISRTLYITYIGAEYLPYIWIASTLVIASLIPFYKWRIEKFSQKSALVSTYVAYALFLFAFRYLLASPSQAKVIAFYIVVDAYIIILVEKAWSLANSTFSTSDSTKFYGLITSGGLWGGVIGSLLASTLLGYLPVQSVDLIFVSVALTLVAFLVSRRINDTAEQTDATASSSQPHHAEPANSFTQVSRKTYLAFLATILLLSQMVQPIVEYQFLHSVEQSFVTLKTRTIFLSWFFALVSAVALIVNYVVTPIMYRKIGAAKGLFVQPVVVFISTIFYLAYPTLIFAATLKVADKSPAYSIGRSSRELLFIPFGKQAIYLAKVLVDMLGNKLSKILGSLLILFLTGSLGLSVEQLGWFTIALCICWALVVQRVCTYYKSLSDIDVVEPIPPKLPRELLHD